MGDVKMKIQLIKTIKGFPAFWESGGGMTSSGSATIVVDKYYGMKRAIYIPRGGHLSNGNHALIGMQIGDRIISYTRSQGKNTLTDFQISKIFEDGERLFAEVVEKVFVNEEINEDIMNEAYRVVIEKSHIYHCRDALFISNEVKK
jgi:hypothetical protein